LDLRGSKNKLEKTAHWRAS